MGIIHRSMQWLFSPPAEPVTALGIIGWWELRRIPYNMVIGAYGILSFSIFMICITTSGRLQPGDDAIEPIALFMTPFAINFCYTAGWLVDAPLRLMRPSLRPEFTLLLFRVGLGFSLILISIPALLWGGIRLLQLLHVLH